jgi:hypothetical protein
VDAPQVVLGRLGRAAEVEIAGQARHVEEVLEPPFRLGAFGQPARGLRLDEARPRAR